MIKSLICSCLITFSSAKTLNLFHRVPRLSMTTSPMKGVFVGSGSEGLQNPLVCTAIIEKTGKQGSDITVLYLGTGTYDLGPPKKNQTIRLAEAGCKITEFQCDRHNVNKHEMQEKVEAADVIIASGGNTLYAIDLWRECGLVPLLTAAMQRGIVLAGGSLGAVCWFDGAHSDSADPDTYKVKMLRDAVAAAGDSDDSKDEASSMTTGEAAKEWQYIRAPCLGFLPGLVCPHSDKIQSNNVLRSRDFDNMLLAHPGEHGLCIDHFAALLVEGDSYSVLSLPGQPGSVLPDGSLSEDRTGVPGVWTKDVVRTDGGMTVVTTLAPMHGHLGQLLKKATVIVDDSRLEQLRAMNPI